MIKPEQMHVATTAARKLTAICAELNALHDTVRAAGMHLEADAVAHAQSKVYDVGATLEREATETFVALRQGRPTP